MNIVDYFKGTTTQENQLDGLEILRNKHDGNLRQFDREATNLISQRDRCLDLLRKWELGQINDAWDPKNFQWYEEKRITYLVGLEQTQALPVGEAARKARATEIKKRSQNNLVMLIEKFANTLFGATAKEKEKTAVLNFLVEREDLDELFRKDDHGVYPFMKVYWERGKTEQLERLNKAKKAYDLHLQESFEAAKANADPKQKETKKSLITFIKEVQREFPRDLSGVKQENFQALGILDKYTGFVENHQRVTEIKAEVRESNQKLRLGENDGIPNSLLPSEPRTVEETAKVEKKKTEIGAKKPKKQNFFVRIFSGIGNFFKKIFQWFGSFFKSK